jgi:hypothetical protein
MQIAETVVGPRPHVRPPALPLDQRRCRGAHLLFRRCALCSFHGLEELVLNRKNALY